MTAPRKRILFFAEGATMAHFVRPLVLADSLDRTEYEIFFYAPDRFFPLLAGKSFEIAPLATLPQEQFLANLAKGAPMYSAQTLRSYVGEDRRIIRQIRPDLIVGDLRLTLPISARLESFRFAMIMNAYWSPWANHPQILPEIPLTRIVSPNLLSPVYKLLAPVIAAQHVGLMNRVRREFGVPALPLQFGHMYMDGDYVLHPDIPEFVGTPGKPPNHQFIGICDWSLPMEKPEWWLQMLDDPRPKVLVSLGSSGQVRTLPDVLKALTRLPVASIVATSGRNTAPVSASYVTNLVPLSETLRHTDLLICHGGSPLVYPALAAGVPILGIPSNADQHLSTHFLKKSGAGLGVRAEEASASKLTACIERLLSDARFKENARKWKTIYARYDSGNLFREFVRTTLG